MALKVIKRLLAFLALPKGFAGRRSELGEQFGMGGSALGTVGNFLVLPGWGDAEFFQLGHAFFGDPVRGPGRTEHGLDLYILETGLLQCRHDLYLDHVHGRATGIGGGDHYLHAAFGEVHIADDAEIGDGQYRDLRVYHRFQQGPDRGDIGGRFHGYHSRPG